MAIEWSRESLFPPNDYCSPEARPSRYFPLHIAPLSGLSCDLPPNVSKVKGSWRLGSISSQNLQKANNSTRYSARVLIVWSLNQDDVKKKKKKIAQGMALDVAESRIVFFYHKIVT